MSARLEQTKREIIRTEFLAGASLRELAGRHGVSLRTLANYSKQGGWEEQRRMQLCATHVPLLVKAADARVEILANHWHSRVGQVLANTAEVALAVSEKLRVSDLGKMNVRELSLTLKNLLDSMDRLAVFAEDDRQNAPRPLVTMRFGPPAKDGSKRFPSAEAGSASPPAS